MANDEQLAILRESVSVWNRWRSGGDRVIELEGAHLQGADLAGVNFSKADLRYANLNGANLSGAILRRSTLSSATLSGATLQGAHLDRAALVDTVFDDAVLASASIVQADLHGARLARANLTNADLTSARLPGAKLRRANLRGALLRWAELKHADIDGANLTGAHLVGTFLASLSAAGTDFHDAILADTVFANVDLSEAIGLERVVHRGPSILDHHTLAKSRQLPLSFLRGCGLPDRLIDYLPSLFSPGSIQFYTCFISYSVADQAFAERLHADLQAKGIRCWFAPHDMQPGRKILEQIDEAIRAYDRLLLILSTESMASRWVRTEIDKARKKELASGRHVLFPVSLVPFSDVQRWELFNDDLGEDTAREIRGFFLPDFSDWKSNHDGYRRSLEKVVAALTGPQ